MPWVGNFAAWEEKHFVGKNIADEVSGAPSWTVTSKGSKTIRSAPLPIAGVRDEYILAGRYDLLVEVVCTDDDHLLTLLQKTIRGTRGVTATETFQYLKLNKQRYDWGAR